MWMTVTVMTHCHEAPPMEVATRQVVSFHIPRHTGPIRPAEIACGRMRIAAAKH